uniref:Uncharacterized protein n=1 Tax=Oryza sativa subsp. japonica TaxID=39947 RepID=Q2R4B5_ORYSJ|nr:hypothetical protein LOC_Os11g29060 [Oryza sativa Japonica Group]
MVIYDFCASEFNAGQLQEEVADTGGRGGLLLRRGRFRGRRHPQPAGNPRRQRVRPHRQGLGEEAQGRLVPVRNGSRSGSSVQKTRRRRFFSRWRRLPQAARRIDQVKFKTVDGGEHGLGEVYDVIARKESNFACSSLLVHLDKQKRGYYFSHPVASHLGYPPQTGSSGYYCDSIATFGLGGSFYSGAWVAI